jgi:hypothetical protein
LVKVRKSSMTPEEWRDHVRIINKRSDDKHKEKRKLKRKIWGIKNRDHLTSLDEGGKN